VVVEAHQGKIWAENREGKGAIFYIRIPIGEREGVH
jgi:signal transduction histidine kinase